MAHFRTVPAASEFIVSLIARQAMQRQEPLSAIEREMLHFSESGWTPPGMAQTLAAFELECVEAHYEKRIANLIASLLNELRKGRKAELAAWCEAVQVLRQEDRYLLVMIDEAGAGAKVRPPGDLWKLWGTALAICAMAGLIGFFLPSNFSIGVSREFVGFWLWAVAAASVAAYAIFYSIVGKAKALELTDRFLGKLLGVFHKPK